MKQKLITTGQVYEWAKRNKAVCVYGSDSLLAYRIADGKEVKFYMMAKGNLPFERLWEKA